MTVLDFIQNGLKRNPKHRGNENAFKGTHPAWIELPLVSRKASPHAQILVLDELQQEKITLVSTLVRRDKIGHVEYDRKCCVEV